MNFTLRAYLMGLPCVARCKTNIMYPYILSDMIHCRNTLITTRLLTDIRGSETLRNLLYLINLYNYAKCREYRVNLRMLHKESQLFSEIKKKEQDLSINIIVYSILKYIRNLLIYSSNISSDDGVRF